MLFADSKLVIMGDTFVVILMYPAMNFMPKDQFMWAHYCGSNERGLVVGCSLSLSKGLNCFSSYCVSMDVFVIVFSKTPADHFRLIV